VEERAELAQNKTRASWAGKDLADQLPLARPSSSPLPHTHAHRTFTHAMSAAGATDGLSDVYEALEQYGWDDDVEFQSGLSAILGSNSTPEQAAELALRARCFYYARCVSGAADAGRGATAAHDGQEVQHQHRL
jgi:hypothetical protein